MRERINDLPVVMSSLVENWMVMIQCIGMQNHYKLL